MKGKILILLILICFKGFSQSKSSNKSQIKSTILNFLEWYKFKKADTRSNIGYSLIKGGYPDSITQRLINFDGVEKYLIILNQEDFLSQTFLNNIRNYFVEVNQNLKLIQPSNQLIPIPGLENDIVLGTIEPDAILNNFQKGTFDKVFIIYDKALVRLRISKYLKLIFTLTKDKNKWRIDYIGYDNSYKNSFGNQ